MLQNKFPTDPIAPESPLPDGNLSLLLQFLAEASKGRSENTVLAIVGMALLGFLATGIFGLAFLLVSRLPLCSP